MTAVAALVLLGTPATSVWPLEGLPATGAQLFQPSPRVNGNAVASCGGTAPVRVNCATPFGEDACKWVGCGPNVQGALAYTGSITSRVWGKDRFQNDRYVQWSCTYIAGSSTQVGGIVSGGCQGGSNAPYECNKNPSNGLTECGNWLWPPFRLEGVASPPPAGVAALGSWSTTVERVSQST